VKWKVREVVGGVVAMGGQEQGLGQHCGHTNLPQEVIYTGRKVAFTPDTSL
jgi:hypothetical protein